MALASEFSILGFIGYVSLIEMWGGVDLLECMFKCKASYTLWDVLWLFYKSLKP